MPSGTHLTIEDRDRILKLAGLRDSDGGFKLAYSQIAQLCGIHAETVSAVIRMAAVKWGQEHAYHESSG
jgi:hypothetical protein